MTLITRLFPLWAIVFSVAAYTFPSYFIYKNAIIPLLTMVMFGMGMSLSLGHFQKVFRKPAVIGFGVFLQFAVMPLAGFGVAKILGLSTELTVGMVIVGSCPGGTASNVICYLGNANVALSILLTMTSTLLAIFATPALTWVYVGQTVDVPVLQMLSSILQIVVIPVLLGTVINTLWGKRLERIGQIFPLISVVAIVIIIAIIVALNRPQLADIGPLVVLAVVLHNLTGVAGGYFLPKLFGYDEQTCRTIAVEVGMQNSGLGVALATKFFSAAAALPGAVFSIWHNLSGSLLAGYWRSKNGATKK